MSVSSGQEDQLSRTISLVGAIALVVGAVIGAGIYVLVGKIAFNTGETLWLAFTIAMLVSLIGVLPLIQLAAAIPGAGGGYLYVSRMLGPFAGVVVSYWVILGGSASTALVCITLAKSIAPILPFALGDHWLGLIIFLLFYGIYQFGMSLAISLQVIMAAQLLLAMLLYTGAGLLYAAPGVDFTLPRGPGPFIEAVILCYTTCMGFQVVAELGEEIKNARRNIPLALFIGGGIVAALYIGIGVVFVGVMGYDENGYKALAVPLTDSARIFLPSWTICFIALGAITAGLTSLNAAAIALPRELFAQGRDGIAPHWLAIIDHKTHTPKHAVTMFTVVVVVLLLLGQDADFYSLLAGIGIMIMSAGICVASLRLPGTFPQRYADAYVCFPKWLLWACTLFTVLTSLGLVALLAMERPAVIAVYAGWTIVVAACYRYWTRGFQAADWARIRRIPGETDAG